MISVSRFIVIEEAAPRAVGDFAAAGANTPTGREPDLTEVVRLTGFANERLTVRVAYAAPTVRSAQEGLRPYRGSWGLVQPYSEH